MAPRRYDHTATALALDDFEVWRRRGIALLLITAVLLAVYWVLWIVDRSLIASANTARYIAFEQSFPLADGWLLVAALVAALQLWRRRPNALIWLCVVGGAAAYLCALDVLYDLQHGIYAKGHGGAIELAINLATAAMSIGTLWAGSHFLKELLEQRDTPDSQAARWQERTTEKRGDAQAGRPADRQPEHPGADTRATERPRTGQL